MALLQWHYTQIQGNFYKPNEHREQRTNMNSSGCKVMIINTISNIYMHRIMVNQSNDLVIPCQKHLKRITWDGKVSVLLENEKKKGQKGTGERRGGK